MAATLPSVIAPRVADLVRLLGSDEDAEALDAARALRRTLVGAGVDLDVLAAVISPTEPIRVSPVRSSRRTTSIRCRQADKLTKAAADPYSNLTRWERDFIASNVPALRSDADLSEKQTATLKRVLSKIRGHRS
ncbi:hypothetical protein [Lichenibacterium dinghuense]|uniref:hypothetical protein n=1 Tax=Lichenibacterium dinghuense TaxID=2895977 RepID=UPI001F3244D4|nr:hypothetical protein [Lichenibacterium sp. 6Y81]